MTTTYEVTEIEECGGCGSDECDDPSCEDRWLERCDESEVAS